MRLFYLLCILLIETLQLCQGETYVPRSLDATVNPGCPDQICDNSDDRRNIITVVHIAANGPTDCLHYIWDFTGKPSILIALTPLNTTVTIDWYAFMSDSDSSIRFSQRPIYTSTITLSRLWQFNDVDDTGSFPVSGTNSTELTAYDTQNITWVRTDFSKSVHDVEVAVAGDNTYLFGDGKIKLKLKCFGTRNHDTEFPHLMHSENATQFDFVLDNIRINASYKSARFAAEMVFISSEAKSRTQQSFTVQNRKSLDDEYTPGIFELVEIASPETLIGARGSYIQYRPVSYTHPERDVSTSTELHITKPSNLDNPVEQLNTSLAWAYYGYMLNEVLVQGFNVSFGLSGDGFYAKTNYSTWTFVMGYGAPPNEQLSMFVVIVASIGLGLPLLLFVGGGCYICIKRARNR